MWPAFWFLGANLATDGWPICGEIDVTEMFGGTSPLPNGDATILQSIHYYSNFSMLPNHEDHASTFYSTPGNVSFHSAFHVFWLEWNATNIVMGVDNLTVTNYILDANRTAFIQKNFVMIFSLAVGGTTPGPPDKTTVFPNQYCIDWVRAYNYTGCPPTTQSTNPSSTNPSTTQSTTTTTSQTTQTSSPNTSLGNSVFTDVYHRLLIFVILVFLYIKMN